MAKVFELNDERMCILGVREGVVQPFIASQWLDLRIGMYLSLTADDDDDEQEGLAETLVGDDIPPADRHWIGIKNQSQALPFEGSTPFIGFTNTDPSPISHTNTGKLVQSNNVNVEGGGGQYWRSKSGLDVAHSGTFGIWEGSGRLSGKNDQDIHFVKTPVAGAFCTLIALRFMRTNPDSQHISVRIPRVLNIPNHADLLFSSDPSEAALDVALETWTTHETIIPAVTMKVVPNSFFCYWPYRQSRLRIHAWGMFRAN